MMTYYHQLDPYLIYFGKNFIIDGIRWYSLAYIAGAVFTYLAGIYLIQKDRIQIPKDKLVDVVVYATMGAVIGGRLGYCLFYQPELFISFDRSFPYWGLLKIHQGGMASHGGMIGFLISQVLYARYHKLSFFSLLDLGAFGSCIGFFLGRIANFINGELFGRVVEGTTWFAVRFPSEIYLWADHPNTYKAQLVSLKSLLPTLDSTVKPQINIPSAHTWETWISKATEGHEIYQGYISYIGSLIVENSHKAPIKELLEPLLFLRYPSQLYQSALGGLTTFFILCLFWLKPRKAGLVTLVFAISYLSFRVLTEFYRQPDSHIGFQFLNLTRGQWLSLLLLLIVIIYGYLVYRQEPRGFRKI